MVEADSATPGLMYRPPDVQYLTVDRSYRARGLDAEIRRYRWSEAHAGPLQPRHHFLDLSLTRLPRRSLLAQQPSGELRHPGRIVFLPAGYSCRGVVDLTEHRSLCLVFDEQFLRETLAGQGEVHLRACLDVRNAMLRSLLMSLADELLAPGFGSEVYLQATVAALIVQLTRLDHKNAAPAPPASRDPRRVSRVRELIQNNLHRQIDLNSLADTVGSSVRHLARTFKATTGMTLGEYVAQSRIARAMTLLHDPHLPVQQISAQCGFASAQYFAHAFRRAAGESPTAFRRSVTASRPQ